MVGGWRGWCTDTPCWHVSCIGASIGIGLVCAILSIIFDWIEPLKIITAWGQLVLYLLTIRPVYTMTWCKSLSSIYILSIYLSILSYLSILFYLSIHWIITIINDTMSWRRPLSHLRCLKHHYSVLITFHLPVRYRHHLGPSSYYLDSSITSAGKKLRVAVTPEHCLMTASPWPVIPTKRRHICSAASPRSTLLSEHTDPCAAQYYNITLFAPNASYNPDNWLIPKSCKISNMQFVQVFHS